MLKIVPFSFVYSKEKHKNKTKNEQTNKHKQKAEKILINCMTILCIINACSDSTSNQLHNYRHKYMYEDETIEDGKSQRPKNLYKLTGK